MMLKFSYDMRIAFSAPVTRHYYSLKLLPQNTSRQRVREVELLISPKAEEHSYTDVWGSEIVYGCIMEEHDYFEAAVQGVCETGFAVYENYSNRTDIYKIPTPYTKAGAEIIKFYNEIKKFAPADRYERVLYFMNSLYEHMSYVPGTTDVKTTAEAAFLRRSGVCQDYAQIFIALMRLDLIPSRYVVGMMMGEGESHAWAEVNLNGYWYGLDPTNNLLADDYYIKISHGRDCRDCMVSRGVFHGIACQVQEVRVNVEKI